MLVESLESRGFRLESIGGGHRLLLSHAELMCRVELLEVVLTDRVSVCHLILDGAPLGAAITVCRPQDVDRVLIQIGAVGIDNKLMQEINACLDTASKETGEWNSMCAVVQRIVRQLVVVSTRQGIADILLQGHRIGTLVLLAGQVIVNLQRPRTVQCWKFTLNKYFPATAASMLEFIRMIEGGLCRSTEECVLFGGLDRYLVQELLSYLDISTRHRVCSVCVDMYQLRTVRSGAQ